MNTIPLVTAQDIVVRRPLQTLPERNAGYHRVVGMFHLEQEVSICDHVARINGAHQCADRLLRTVILRRMYPVEIRTEFSRLEESIIHCRSINGYDARQLLEQVAALRRQLCPNA